MLEKESASVKLNERVLEAKLKHVLWENAMTEIPNNKRYCGDVDQERAFRDYTHKAYYPDGKLFTHVDHTHKVYPGHTHEPYPDHNQLNPDHIRIACPDVNEILMTHVLIILATCADVNEMNLYHTHEACLDRTRMNPG